MRPKLVTFCAHPVTGKTTLSNYMQNELDFARIGWDELEKAASIPSCPHPNYDFRDESWRQLSYFRDMYLSSERDVVIDGCATSAYARAEIFKTQQKCEKYTIVININPLLHLWLFRKRVPEERIDGQVIGRIKLIHEWEDPKYDENSRIIRLHNWSPLSLSRMKRKIRNRLEC